MTEIEMLVEQAEQVLRTWHKQKTINPPVSNLSWQEILDGKPYPHLRHGKL